MSHQERQKSQSDPPYFDNSLVINTRLSEIERQQHQEAAERKEHERSQRRSNWTMVVFTALLFVTSTVSDVILIRQTNIARESADAAKSAADAATRTLEEVKKGGSDTHALAVAAQQQASSSEALARNAGHQVEEMRSLSQAAKRTADASLQQSRTSASQLQAAERPWVTVDAYVDSDLMFLSGTANISIRFVLTNVGHTPAMNASVFPDLVPLRGRIEHRDVTCRSDRENFRKGGIIGDTIFPTQSIEVRYALSISPEAVKNFQFRIGRIGPSVTGCATYGSSFDTEVHQTGFLYDIIRNDPTDPRDHTIPTNIDTPKTELKLRKYLLGYGSFAN